LDIIELTDPVHSGEYLAEKLSEITDSLKITKAVFTITRDNAAPNNTMLNEFEAAASFMKIEMEIVQNNHGVLLAKKATYDALGTLSILQSKMR
jgi:hypothetical protein